MFFRQLYSRQKFGNIQAYNFARIFYFLRENMNVPPCTTFAKNTSQTDLQEYKKPIPQKKYRGMFVFVFGVTNTLRNVFTMYKMVSFILEGNIDVCLLLIPTISGNLPQHNTIRPSLRKRKKQKDINISQRIIQFTYMSKRYGIT